MKTKTQISFAVTAKLISAFAFAIRIVQFLYYLYPKFQASSHLLELYRLVRVGPGRKPERWFSHDAAYNYNFRDEKNTFSSGTSPYSLIKEVAPTLEDRRLIWCTCGPIWVYESGLIWVLNHEPDRPESLGKLLLFLVKQVTITNINAITLSH